MAKPSLSRGQMRQYLMEAWQRNALLPVLHRLTLHARSGRISRERLHRELVNVLHQFESETGVLVQVVEDGAVQVARGSGNLSSLRSRPGHLQMERQVFRDTERLRAEVTHELAYHYAGGRSGVPLLGEGPVDALSLMESMITTSPQRVLEFLTGD